MEPKKEEPKKVEAKKKDESSSEESSSEEESSEDEKPKKEEKKQPEPKVGLHILAILVHHSLPRPLHTSTCRQRRPGHALCDA